MSAGMAKSIPSTVRRPLYLPRPERGRRRQADKVGTVGTNVGARSPHFLQRVAASVGSGTVAIGSVTPGLINRPAISIASRATPEPAVT